MEEEECIEFTPASWHKTV